MKQVVLCSVLMLMVITSFGQPSTPAPQYSKAYFLKKARTQKTFAWVLVGAGTVGLVSTFWVDAFTALASLGQSNANYTTPYLISAACVVGSIPLFVAGSKNMKRALHAAAFLKLESPPQPQKLTLKKQNYPTLTVRLRLP